MMSNIVQLSIWSLLLVLNPSVKNTWRNVQTREGTKAKIDVLSMD